MAPILAPKGTSVSVERTTQGSWSRNLEGNNCHGQDQYWATRCWAMVARNRNSRPEATLELGEEGSVGSPAWQFDQGWCHGAVTLQISFAERRISAREVFLEIGQFESFAKSFTEDDNLLLSTCSVTASMRLEIEGSEGLGLFVCSIPAVASRMAGEGRGLCKGRFEW